MSDEMNGLWTIKFISGTQNMGAGVIVIVDNMILGGDSQYFYAGPASVVNDVVNADIAVKVHTKIQGCQSIFGPIDAFNLMLTGKINPAGMVLQGRVKELSGGAITVLCTRVAALGAKKGG